MTVTVFPFANCSGRCNILALPRRIHPALRSDVERTLAIVKLRAFKIRACDCGRQRNMWPLPCSTVSGVLNSPLLLGTNKRNPPTLHVRRCRSKIAARATCTCSGQWIGGALASGESRDDGAVTLGLFFFYMKVPWHQRRGFYSDQSVLVWNGPAWLHAIWVIFGSQFGCSQLSTELLACTAVACCSRVHTPY